ncbi:chromosome segregation protein SMC [Candidatus Rubidus massiliensis]|nr:chromosome segregation protein SMC [Candidatus Rubidus massiliensis]
MSATIDHKLASMQKEMELAKKRAAESDEEKASLLQTIEELKNQILNQKSSKECSKIAVKPQEDKEKLRLHQQIDTLQKDNKDLQEKLKAAISTPQEKSTAVVEQYNKLQQQTLEAKKEAEKAKQQADEAKKETEKTKQQLAEVAEEKQSFENAFKTRESQYKELSAINEVLASEIETLKIALDEKEDSCQKLSGEIEALKQELKNKQDYFNDRLQNNTNEVSIIDTLKDQLKNSVAKVKTEGYPSIEDLKNLREEIDNVNKELEPLAAEFIAVRKRQKNDYKTFYVNEKNLPLKTEIYNKYFSEFKKLKDDFVRLEPEIQKLKSEFEIYQNKKDKNLSLPFDEPYTLQVAIKSKFDLLTLKTDHEKYDEEYDKLQTSFNKLVSSQGNCTWKIGTLGSGIDSMKGILENYDKTLYERFFGSSKKEKDPAKTN